MKNIFLLILFVVSFTVNAQRPSGQRPSNPIKITGIALDNDNNQPLEYATLVLQSVENPDNITGGITNEKGEFSVETAPGIYNIRVEYISYTTYRLDNQDLKTDTNIGTVKLSIDVEQLEAVEVVGERTTVEVRLDKKIYNIGKDITTSGGSVTDALENIPSVSVDAEGAISLRGNENVRILINGKPSAMAGFGSNDALKQIPSDAIERVEVITSPSARYDAEGTAGILNIVLKKEKTLGVNGSVNASIGTPTREQLSTNLNFRTKKFNIFTTLGYSHNAPPGNMHFENTYNGGTYSKIIEDRTIERNRSGFNINLGTEYFINDKSSITATYFTRISDNMNAVNNNTERFVGTASDSRTIRTEDQDGDNTNNQFSLNYTNNFDDEGHKLTTDFQYSTRDQDQIVSIEENNIFPVTDLLARENIYEKEKQNNYLAQADYVLPMGDAQFEAGYRGSYREEASDYQLDTLNQGTGQFITNTDLSNKFTYTQNVNAFYSQYGNKYGKFSFLLGLRLESTKLKGEVESDINAQAISDQFGGDIDVNFEKDYLGLFPTLNLILELAENESISLGYNRRINRPRGWFINPFPSRSSRTNIFQGNPDLDPAFSNAFDLGYLKRWKKLTLTSSVYFQKETNSFSRVQQPTGEETSDGISIIRSIPINLATNERLGAEMGIMYNPARWLRINTSFNFFKFNTEGEFGGVDYGAESTSWFSRFSSKVTLPAKIEWQTNMFYRGPNENSQTKTDAMYFLSFALSKDIIKDKATLTLNVNDVLNSSKRKSVTETEFFTSVNEFQWRSRQFRLSLIYRFNQPQGRGRGGRRGGAPGGGGGDDGGGEGGGF